jgi:hypothetical protein
MRVSRVLAVLAAVTLLVAACGDDDGATTTAGDESEADSDAASAPEADLSTFCDAYLEAFDVVSEAIGGGETEEHEHGGEDGGTTTTTAAGRAQATSTTAPGGQSTEHLEEMLGEVEASAPEEIAEDLQVTDDAIREAAASGDTSGLETDEVREANDNLNQFTAENCADTTLDVTATDYAFEGIPDEVAAGRIGFTFDNQGQEVHELVLLRFDDGVNTSVEDLVPHLEEGPEGLEGEATLIDAVSVVAEPGEQGAALAELEPGRYGVVCLIPVGTLSADEAGSGHAHAEEGMVAEFTVT